MLYEYIWKNGAISFLQLWAVQSGNELVLCHMLHNNTTVYSPMSTSGHLTAHVSSTDFNNSDMQTSSKKQYWQKEPHFPTSPVQTTTHQQEVLTVTEPVSASLQWQMLIPFKTTEWSWVSHQNWDQLRNRARHVQSSSISTGLVSISVWLILELIQLSHHLCSCGANFETDYLDIEEYNRCNITVRLPPNPSSLSLSRCHRLPPSSGMVLPQSSPSARGWAECEGLVGGEPAADGASTACSRSKPEGGEQLAGCARRPGVRPAGVTATHQPGPAEGQYARYSTHLSIKSL